MRHVQLPLQSGELVVIAAHQIFDAQHTRAYALQAGREDRGVLRRVGVRGQLARRAGARERAAVPARIAPFFTARRASTHAVGHAAAAQGARQLPGRTRTISRAWRLVAGAALHASRQRGNVLGCGPLSLLVLPLLTHRGLPR
jgi:hypothetical protein